MDGPAAVKALARLLRNGSHRGKNDVVTALFNLSTNSECCLSMMDLGTVYVLDQALPLEGVSQEAVGALALLVRQRFVAEVMVVDNMAKILALLVVMYLS